MASILLGVACLSASAAAQQADVRPAFHFAPARNWTNDPNGLVYYDGEYHLFFQYNPYGDRWGHMSWGHAVSRDLVTWQELPVAIPETPDVMAFSGSAVVDWTNSSGFGRDGHPPMIAIYTGHNPKAQRQSQYLAYSNDHGRTWTVHGEVLNINMAEFRDPKVFWHAASKRWVMVVVKALENQAQIYTSPDLKHWTFASDFGPAGGRGKNWECPDLFELSVEGGAPGEKRWVMVINLGDNGVAGGSGAQYFVGDFDGTRFTPVADWGKAPRWVDHGADFYAVASWNDLPRQQDRRVWIAWANDWRYANTIPTYPSRGLMTLPRQVFLRKTDQGYQLAQQPVEEITRYRGAPTRMKAVSLSSNPTPIAIDGARSDLQVDLETGSAQQIIFALTDDKGYQTLVGVNPQVDEVFVDRTRSGPHFNDSFEDRHVTAVDLKHHKVTLRILADQSILEVFVNDGTHTISDRFFPGGGNLRWSVATQGGTATMNLTAWPLLTATAKAPAG
ncbi:glycoside hydrolase family 32 protein [Novosphingobium rosa]|uniref:glycoside hydrolase family 32 protein n=1 Tax=Novosphingobium rosa TaxID=76978 RepID=UPI001FDFE0EC|nr:glycoside hydrolase family 32 protein [Novosphingobium rosa]